MNMMKCIVLGWSYASLLRVSAYTIGIKDNALVLISLEIVLTPYYDLEMCVHAPTLLLIEFNKKTPQN